MRTIKLCLLFLFIPFISLGQGNCYNGQTEIFIEIWQIGGTGLGTYTFQIQNISGTEYFGPVQFSGASQLFILCMFRLHYIPLYLVC